MGERTNFNDTYKLGDRQSSDRSRLCQNSQQGGGDGPISTTPTSLVTGRQMTGRGYAKNS